MSTSVAAIETKVKTFLSWLGTEFDKDFPVFEKYEAEYEPTVATLAGILFPANPAAAGVLAAVDLVQKSVISVEQKYAAAGIQTGTGPQKLAEVLAITTPAVTQLLASEGVKADATKVQAIVNLAVAVLNAKDPPAPPAAAATAAAPAVP